MALSCRIRQTSTRTFTLFTSSSRTSKEELWNSVSSFDVQKAIANTAKQKSNRLTPRQLMYGGKPGDKRYLVKTAQYLHRELPIRVAHRIHQFQHLPFIVGCNPHILSVHWQYLRSFQKLSRFRKIENNTDEQEFTNMIRDLLHDHRGVVTSIAKGFTECKNHIEEEKMQNFLDYLLSSRLGIRMLCEHQISMQEDKPGFVGIVQLKMSLKTVIQRCVDFARKVCYHQFRVAPDVAIDGHVGATFAYIPAPLEYILQELLKNSMRATVQFHKGGPAPSVRVTICNNPTDFTVRISDMGGGISQEKIDSLLQYASTTANVFESGREEDDHDIFSRITANPNSGPAAGPMAGYGYGFPISCCFARYLGGDLQLVSMSNTGSDAYLRLKHFDVQPDSFYI